MKRPSEFTERTRDHGGVKQASRIETWDDRSSMVRSQRRTFFFIDNHGPCNVGKVASVCSLRRVRLFSAMGNREKSGRGGGGDCDRRLRAEMGKFRASREP